MRQPTEEQIKEQIELERYYKTLAEEEFRKRLETARNRGNLTNHPIGGGMKRLFIDVFAENLEKWAEEQTKPRRGVAKTYRPLLIKLVEAFGLKDFVLNACATTLETAINQILAGLDKKVSISKAGYQIGLTLYYNGYTEAFLKEEDEEGTQLNRIQEGLNNRTLMYQKRKHVKHIMENKFKFHWHKIDRQEILALGAELLNILVKSTDLINVRSVVNQGSFLEPTQTLLDTYRRNADFFAKFITDRTPTIIPPKSWRDMNNGGYYGLMADRLHFMRINHLVGRTKVVKSYIDKIRDVDLSNIYKAVNSIQETAYRINLDVYKVIEDIFNQGGNLAGIPQFEPTEEPKRKIKETKQDFMKRWLPWHEEEVVRRSKALRCMRLFRYAKDFKNRERIYFPCNIDFRGRIYPIPAFNHQGDDFMKALIEYSDPVPLKDEKDIELLWWQGANLWGNDKVSHAEQVEWVKSHHLKILDSARHPLEYLWWTEADEPLQFLAWCMEYAKAEDYRNTTGSYNGYICHIVISYDGTCSGLQHYSAILRDEVGGSAVNLIDHERPADIYQEVADKVKKVVEYDALYGTLDDKQKEATGGGQRIHFGTRTLAQAWLAYGINRKVVKRNVMTLAYGSGQYGFQEQIYEDTTKNAKEFERIAKPCAKYLAKIVWNQVQDTVVSATAGMKYLKQLAGVLIKHDLPVNWWTPLGLPVQQQYLKTVTKYFRTRFGESTNLPLYYQEIDPNEDIDANSQKNGIAPNFIHSLDSTHLMMTVNEANLSNYTTIHDSFGTSLGEARILQRVIREQLYRLYTEYSPIEEFKKYVEEMTGEDLSNLDEPPKGNLDLKCILESTFIFH